MPKNSDVTTDAKENLYLASLPTPNKLWVVVVDENEAAIATTNARTDLTQSLATKYAVTSVTCSGRTIVLMGPFTFEGTTELPRAFMVLTDDPANGAPSKPYYFENIVNAAVAEDLGLSIGDAWDFSVHGPLNVDGIAIECFFQGET